MARRIHCGINIDPANELARPSVQEIQDLGATWVRFVFKDDSDALQPARFPFYDDQVWRLNQAGINILMVLNNETYPGKPASDADDATWDVYIAQFANRCRQIAQHYGSQVQAYQIWNEQDHGKPTSSYDPCVRAEVFGPLLRAVFTAIKGVSSATVVMGGLAAGHTGYLEQVKASTDGELYVDAVGVHPYGRRPMQDWPYPGWGFGVLGDLIGEYQAKAAGKPIWITEVGTRDTSVVYTDGTFCIQDEFPGRTLRALNQDLAETTPYVFWFCWSDSMESPLGLMDDAKRKKKSYTSFQEFASLPFEGEVFPMVTVDEILLRNVLLAEAEVHQMIQLNPNAALQMRIFADGFVPNSNEFDVQISEVQYRAQRAEHLGTGQVRVYYAKVPEWYNVRFVERP